MSKTEQLIIRACKSEDPVKRLKSIYRRFYISRSKLFYNMIYILGGIIDKYNSISICYFISEVAMKKTNATFFKEGNYNETEAMLDVLINHIRFSENIFQELNIPLPLYWKNIALKRKLKNL